MIVLDASAVLAFLQDETGAGRVRRALSEGIVGAANWSEIAQKVRSRNADWDLARAVILDAGIRVVPVTAADAECAARLWQPHAGLSLADRLCLALARRYEVRVLTADRVWVGLPAPLEDMVELIR